MRNDIKVISVWGDFMFSVPFHHHVRVHCPLLPLPQWLFLTLDIWDKEYIGLVKCTGWPFCDLDQSPWLWHSFACLQPITTKRGSYIPLVMLITWLDFGGIFAKFSLKISDVFFKVKRFIGHVSGTVGLNDVKQKGGTWVGNWVNYVTSTLTSPMTLTFDFSRSNFNIAVYKELLSDWCETIRKNQLDTWLTVWACPLTTPMTLTL